MVGGDGTHDTVHHCQATQASQFSLSNEKSLLYITGSINLHTGPRVSSNKSIFKITVKNRATLSSNVAGLAVARPVQLRSESKSPYKVTKQGHQTRSHGSGG